MLEFLSRSVDLRRRLHGECYLRHTWGMGYGTGWVGTCGRLRFTNKAVINLPGVDPPPLMYVTIVVQPVYQTSASSTRLRLVAGWLRARVVLHAARRGQCRGERPRSRDIFKAVETHRGVRAARAQRNHESTDAVSTALNVVAWNGEPGRGDGRGEPPAAGDAEGAPPATDSLDAEARWAGEAAARAAIFSSKDW